jgi:hypothetical protein
MLDVISAINLLLLPLINVIYLLMSDENKSTLIIVCSIFAALYFAVLKASAHLCTDNSNFTQMLQFD